MLPPGQHYDGPSTTLPSQRRIASSERVGVPRVGVTLAALLRLRRQRVHPLAHIPHLRRQPHLNAARNRGHCVPITASTRVNTGASTITRTSPPSAFSMRPVATVPASSGGSTTGEFDMDWPAVCGCPIDPPARDRHRDSSPCGASPNGPPRRFDVNQVPRPPARRTLSALDTSRLISTNGLALVRAE